MFRDDEEWFLEVAERLLEIHSLEELFDMNDVTDIAVLAHLLEAGVLEIPEWLNVGNNSGVFEEDE